MSRIVSTIVEICLLRRGPQHLPRGWAMTVIALAIYVAVYAFAKVQVEGGTFDVAQPLVSVALLLGFCAVVLRLFDFGARLPQTVSALASTSALLTLVTLPLLLSVIADVDAKRPANLAFFLLYVVGFVWSIAIDAHIFRSALSTTLTVGFLVSVLWFAVSVYSRYLLLGQPA